MTVGSAPVMADRVRIAPDTTVGPVHLTVADLERSLNYYTGAIGMRVRERAGKVARLGSEGHELLVLYEEPGARPVQGHTGLFHLALLLPARADLARWLRHAVDASVGLGEIYRDRPREQWPREGDGVGMASLPLDPADLLRAADGGAGAGYDGLPAGTRMGHVHLHVADVPETEAFYRDVLGFDVMAHLGDQATFLSAGGYHHHIGANVWAGQGATPPPPGSAALRYATIVLPDAAERHRVAARVADAGGEVVELDGGALVHDPARNALLLTA